MIRLVSEDSFFLIFEFKNKNEIKNVLKKLSTHQYNINEKYNTLTIFKDTL